MNWSEVVPYWQRVVTVWPWIAVIVFLTAVAFWAYRMGFRRGRDFAKLEGAFCDVCEKVSPKFIYFRHTVMCDTCYQSVKSNKDMKCRFCNEKIEQCSCT